MACFGILYSLVFCSVLLLLRQTFAVSVIEAYKPKRYVGVPPRKDKNMNIENVKDLNKLFKRFEHKIDDADVRQKIMEAQMRFPLAFNPNPNRMEAALEFINTRIPSIIYNDSTIASSNGILLQIFDDGTVNGTMDYTSAYAQLTLESVGSGGVYRIKGTKSQKYMVYKKNGRVMAEFQPGPDHKNVDESIFRSIKTGTRFEGIQSVKYKWNLGFRHNFQMKKGPHVKLRHKGSKFAVIARIG